MALKLDNNLINELGLGALPEQEKQLLLRQIYEKLEMNVGVRLADQMSNEQLDEFEKFVDANDDKGAFQWLESNFPNYKDVVNEEFEKLKAEIKQYAPQMLAVAQQNAQMGASAGPQAGAPGQYQQPTPQPMPGQYQAASPVPGPGQPYAPQGGQPYAAPTPNMGSQGYSQPGQVPQYSQQPPQYGQPQPPMGQYVQPQQPQYGQPNAGQQPNQQQFGPPAPQYPPFPSQQPPAGPGQ